VAEVGEWSPPRAAVDALRRRFHRRSHPFSTVIPIPGRGPTQYHGRTPLGPSLTRSLGDAVSDTIEAARARGADYLLLLSAYAHTDTPEVIRGVPLERRTRKPLRLTQWTQGRAAAVLIRVRDGTVFHKAVTFGLRKDPTVFPGTRKWFYGYPSTLLSRWMMVRVTKQTLRAVSNRDGE
jgi:hypothetical protein